MTDQKKTDALVLAPANLPDALNIRTLATDLINSAFFKGISAVPQAVAIILHGQEIGLSPTVALQTISIVNGRMCISTTVLQALFQKRGGRIKILERSEERARVEFSRPGWETYVHEYTKEDAIAEELWNKDNWKKRRKTMLLYRAISGGQKVFDPGASMGIITTEEMEDYPNGLPEDTVAKPEAEKSPEKAPEAPKQASPTPEASPKAEKPATAPAEAKKPGRPKKSEAPKDGFELEAEPDDIAAMAEHADSKTDEDILVDSIKAELAAAGVDVKEFKAWLFAFQDDERMKLHPRMVVKLGKNLRFHGAVREDLEYLKAQLGGAIAVFRHAKSQAEKK
ncbi:MAG TPA: hypothetical protein VMV44_15655 [Rectinemataceae bacterium]|nr:hypothetical protein [Rectinemataceae bacterium]